MRQGPMLAPSRSRPDRGRARHGDFRPRRGPGRAIERGRAFAEQNCGSCHATGSSGASPLAKAPPFRTLHDRYPVENLTESLAEGIRTGHPAMPQFDGLDTGQIDDLIAYLKSLER